MIRRCPPGALEIITGNDCFVTRAALTEVVYTLESYYRSAHVDIGRALDALLTIQRITVEDRAVTERAVSWVQGRNGFRRCDDCRFVA
jgi:predicted nucleic-acid-binding protein